MPTLSNRSKIRTKHPNQENWRLEKKKKKKNDQKRVHFAENEGRMEGCCRGGTARERGEARGRRGGKPAVQHSLNYSSTSEWVVSDGERWRGKTKREVERAERKGEEGMNGEGGEERAEEEVVAKEGARMAMAKEEGERGRDEG